MAPFVWEPFSFLVPASTSEKFMNQRELNREVAKATGETVATIDQLGFVPLEAIPYERDRDPLVVDWETLEQERMMLYPCAS